MQDLGRSSFVSHITLGSLFIKPLFSLIPTEGSCSSSILAAVLKTFSPRRHVLNICFVYQHFLATAIHCAIYILRDVEGVGIPPHWGRSTSSLTTRNEIYDPNCQVQNVILFYYISSSIRSNIFCTHVDRLCDCACSCAVSN